MTVRPALELPRRLFTDKIRFLMAAADRFAVDHDDSLVAADDSWRKQLRAPKGTPIGGQWVESLGGIISWITKASGTKVKPTRIYRKDIEEGQVVSVRSDGGALMRREGSNFSVETRTSGDSWTKETTLSKKNAYNRLRGDTGESWDEPETVPLSEGDDRTGGLVETQRVEEAPIPEVDAPDADDVVSETIDEVEDILPSDLNLDQISTQRGWDDPAPTGTDSDLDQVIANGGVELWRGVRGTEEQSAADIHRSTREDDPYYPDGLYGRGLYTSTEESDAEFFATGGWVDDEPVPGSVQRLALSPDARVLTYEPISAESNAYRERAQAAGVDISTAAAYDGYDAVRVIGGDTGVDSDDDIDGDNDQYILLNRSAALWSVEEAPTPEVSGIEETTDVTPEVDESVPKFTSSDQTTSQFWANIDTSSTKDLAVTSDGRFKVAWDPDSDVFVALERVGGAWEPRIEYESSEAPGELVGESLLSPSTVWLRANSIPGQELLRQVEVPTSTPTVLPSAAVELPERPELRVLPSIPSLNSSSELTYRSLSVDEMNDHWTEMTRGGDTDLTQDERNAVTSYTVGAGLVNNYLRGNTTNESEHTREVADLVQRSMRLTTRPMEVKRGAGFQEFNLVEAQSLNDLVGQVITDPGFKSTTVSSNFVFTGPVRMTIEVPPGTPALWARPHAHDERKAEDEVTLAAGLSYHVMSVNRQPSGFTTDVRLRVVPSKLDVEPTSTTDVQRLDDALQGDPVRLSDLGLLSDGTTLNEHGHGDMPQDVRQALSQYWKSPAVNRALQQSNGDIAGIEGVGARSATELRNVATGLDAGFNLPDAQLPRDMVSFRGVWSGREVFGDDAWSGNDLTGLSWRNQGYTSTSLNRDTASDFAATEAGDPEPDGVILRMMTPAGTPVLGISNEDEVLLPRDAEFTVIRDNGTDNEGFRQLDVVMTPPVPVISDVVEAHARFDRTLNEGLKGDDALESVPYSHNGVDTPDDVGAALEEYADTGYHVNDYLRGVVDDEPSISENMTANLDRGFQESRLPSDVITWRGFPEANFVFGDAWGNGDLTGLEWTDAGYGSTSTNENVAKDFSVLSSTEHSVVLRIRVPEGSPALAIDSGEDEIVLPRNTRYSVVRDNGVDENGIRRLDVEITTEPTEQVTPKVAPAETTPNSIPVPEAMTGPRPITPTKTVYRKGIQDGEVITQSADGGQRVRWDANRKRFVFETRTADGWQETGALNKKQTYEQLKDGEWYEPDVQLSPVTAPSAIITQDTPTVDQLPVPDRETVPEVIESAPTTWTDADALQLTRVETGISDLTVELEPLLARRRELIEPGASYQEFIKVRDQSDQLLQDLRKLASEKLDLLSRRDGTLWGGTDTSADRWTGLPEGRSIVQPDTDQVQIQKIRDTYVVNDDNTLEKNASLRSGDPTSAAKAWRGRVRKLVNSGRMADDAVVYRGAALTPEIIMGLRPGAVITDPGIMSVDVRPGGTANFYADERLKVNPGTLKVMFNIRVPKGTPTADVSFGEFVFADNTSLRIVSVQRGDDGTINVTAEMGE